MDRSAKPSVYRVENDPFLKRCLTQNTLGPFLVQIWSSSPQTLESTKFACIAVRVAYLASKTKRSESFRFFAAENARPLPFD